MFLLTGSLHVQLEALGWLKKNKIISYAAALSGTVFYHQADFKHPSAIVMGSEARGLSRTELAKPGRLGYQNTDEWKN